MAIPQNFDTVEQQVLSVSNSGASGSQTATFTTALAKNRNDLKIVNGGSKACQVLIGNAPITAVADGSAGGTAQLKVLSGEVIAVKKGEFTSVAAICEGTDTTTLYLHAGTGG